ncbi:MAG: hypothetical protein LBD64_07295 [Odoribacteraceae bacterium]|nr:hypothetical protein [Odoribacteraceae bacterium]
MGRFRELPKDSPVSWEGFGEPPEVSHASWEGFGKLPNPGRGMLFRSPDDRLAMPVHGHANVNGRYTRLPRPCAGHDPGKTPAAGNKFK